MKCTIKNLILSLGFGVLVVAAPVLQAQDILGELTYRCNSVGGILDEDYNCIEPIEAQGGDVTIELSDVELPPLTRVALRSKTLQTSSGDISQQQGLQMCFGELNGNVGNCQDAFQNNADAHNECVTRAGDAYQYCLTSIQTLP